MAEPVDLDKVQIDTESLIARLKELLAAQRRDLTKVHKVHTIINPAAGKDQPILKTLNAAFQMAGIDWEVFVTKTAGDGKRLAEEAVAAKADLVVVHGGDGTVMEAASGLIGTDIPLAIIPGGTANVLSLELGIPNDLVSACALAVNPAAAIRRIDMGEIGEHHFILRASMGFEAAMVEGADRSLKDRLGKLAYPFAALQALADPQIAKYHLLLDGEEQETEGLTCIIANAGNVGLPGISLTPTINVSDGLLDVIVVRRADLPSLVSLIASVVTGDENRNALQHWQVKEVTVTADPPQTIQVDGEILGSSPLTARIIPGAVGIIVPPTLTPEEIEPR